MKLTNEEIGVLKNGGREGAIFTEEDITMLVNDTAPEKTKYWAEKILKQWRQETGNRQKQEARNLQQPVTCGELLQFTHQHLATKQALQEVSLRQAGILMILRKQFAPKAELAAMGKEWLTDEAIERACQEIIGQGMQDMCGSCAVTGCAKTKAALVKSILPLASDEHGNKVCQCSEYAKKVA